RAQGEKLAKALLPKGPVNVSLDQLLADVERTKKEAKSVEVRNDPPRIFVAETPARLVVFDGDPVWSPVEKTDLLVAVNTNWPIFMESGKTQYFLLDGKVWLEATAIKGPWALARALPKSLSNLPSTDQWKDVKAALPLDPARQHSAPQVFVSTTPAEI